MIGPDAVLRAARWGLVPAWARDAEQAAAIRAKALNARCETLWEKPVFREAARTGRCLVVSTGFFEWHETGGRRYPFFIRLRGGDPFVLAGLEAVWRNPLTGREEPTFSIITCPACPLLARIHNTRLRMPVILPEASQTAWLDPGLDPDQAGRLCVPFDDACLEAWPVGPLVGKRGAETNVPEVSRPHDWGVPLPGPATAGPEQLDLFATP